MTLREAFEAHYDKSDLAPRTLQKYRHVLNAWERLTSNPPVHEIDDETAAEFRRRALDAGLAPATVNTLWGDIRAILRRLGPRDGANPAGLGLIQAVPWMKPVKSVLPSPKRVKLPVLSRVYVAAKNMRCPRRAGIFAPDFWRTLLVLEYGTGMRRHDLLNLRWDAVDLEDCTISVTAKKTGKSGVWPIPDWMESHLRRVFRPSATFVLGGCYRGSGGTYWQLWKQLLGHARISSDSPDWFTLKNIRSTAASEIERTPAGRGLGEQFLQHAGQTVTTRHYINLADELRDVLPQMRVPTGFNSGPRMSDTAAQKAAKAAAERQQHLKPSDFHTPTLGTDAKLWVFCDTAFKFNGQPKYWYRLKGFPLTLLQLFVTADGPVAKDAIINLAERRNCEWTDADHQASVEVARLRSRLRKLFALGEWDPLPNLNANSVEGQWQICLPGWLTE